MNRNGCFKYPNGGTNSSKKETNKKNKTSIGTLSELVKKINVKSDKKMCKKKVIETYINIFNSMFNVDSDDDEDFLITFYIELELLECFINNPK